MKSFVNLLPFEYRRRELVRRRLLQWSLVWLVCIAAVTGIGWAKYGRWRRLQQAIGTVQHRYRPLARIISQRDAARGELRKLHARGTVPSELVEQRPVVTLLAVVGRSAQKCDGRLVLRNLTFQRQKAPPATGARQDRKNPKKPQPPVAVQNRPWATVTFEGDALDNLAIAKFAAGLRDTGLFQRVELKSSVGKEAADVITHTFTVECDI